MRKWIIWLVMLSLGSSPILAGETDVGIRQIERAPLKGLAKVSVVVGADDTDDEHLRILGVDRQAIQNKLELEIRRAGIVVADGHKENVPVLMMSFMLLPIQDAAFACNINLSLIEPVSTILEPKRIAMGVTWNDGTLVLIGTSRSSSFRQCPDDLVTTFVNDWMAANPATQPSRFSKKDMSPEKNQSFPPPPLGFVLDTPPQPMPGPERPEADVTDPPTTRPSR